MTFVFGSSGGGVAFAFASWSMIDCGGALGTFRATSCGVSSGCEKIETVSLSMTIVLSSIFGVSTFGGGGVIGRGSSFGFGDSPLGFGVS